MPILSTLSFKVGVVSTFVLTVAVALKFSAPLITEFVASDVPVLWNVLLQWLKPPYLYLIINCIIISILASSKLQKKGEKTDVVGDVYDRRDVSYGVTEKVVFSGDDDDDDDEQSRVNLYEDVREKVVFSGYDDDEEQSRGYGGGFEDVRDLSEKMKDVKEKEKKNVDDSDVIVERSGGDVDSVATVAPVRRNDSMEFIERWFEKESAKQREKPPVSSRFSQKKSAKNNSEGGKALRVAKPKRNDTLESTWKMISEGRAMPLTRHLKKSDTWETHARHNTPPPSMKKSETFHERTSTPTVADGDESGRLKREPSLRLKKEPSLSQDELNRRVEAFIKNFNEEMRMQRQRSIDQYNEMIRRGAS